MAGQLLAPWDGARVGPAAVSALDRWESRVRGAIFGGCLSRVYHVPRPAQDPIFPNPGNYYQPHFTDGETETQTGNLTCPRPSSRMWSGCTGTGPAMGPHAQATQI